jgi:excisionase family DNA binding protein
MSIEYITIDEMAQQLRVRPRTVRRWVTLRQVEFVKAGRGIRIPQTEVHRIVQEGTVPRTGSPVPYPVVSQMVDMAQPTELRAPAVDTSQSFATAAPIGAIAPATHQVKDGTMISQSARDLIERAKRRRRQRALAEEER